MAPASHSVTLGLTAGLALLSALLNSALMRALLRIRPRQRTSGMLALSCLEVALSLLLAGAMLWHAWRVRVNAGALVPLLDLAHALQMVRNHWLVALGALRLAALVRPRGNVAAAATAGAGRGRFGTARQLALLVCLGGLSAVTLFAVAVGFEVKGVYQDDKSLIVRSNESRVVHRQQRSDVVFNLTDFQRDARDILLKYSVFSAAGVLLPGLAVAGIAAKTVHSLHAGQLLHPATRRTTKAVALLCAAFVACQFPLAATYVATAAHLLSLSTASADHVAAIVDLLESVSSWSLVLVPADSCLTFIISARYSRHFRALLLGPRSCCSCDQPETPLPQLPIDINADGNEDQRQRHRHQRHFWRQRDCANELLAMYQLTSANQVTAGVTSSHPPEEDETAAEGSSARAVSGTV